MFKTEMSMTEVQYVQGRDEYDRGAVCSKQR